MLLPWYLRFRTKLVATLFPIFATLTVASVWVAERRFSEVYQQLFETQFHSYIKAFDAAREHRFESISNHLEEIAANPALAALIKEGSSAAMRQFFEPLWQDLGRQRLTLEPSPGRFSRRGDHRPAGAFNNPGSADFSPSERRQRPEGLSPAPPLHPAEKPEPRPPPALIMLLDAEGRTVAGVTPAQSGGGEVRSFSLRQTGSFLRSSDRPFGDWLPAQEVGYVLMDPFGEGRRQAREIFVTPIRDDAGLFLGALVFGLPLPTMDERALYQQSERLERSQIMSGVWVDGHLVSSTIPEAKQSELAALIAPELAEKNSVRGDLTLSINGQRYRVIYRHLNPDSPFSRAAQINLYSLAVLDEEIASLRLNSVKFAAVAMVAAFGLILFVSRGLSGPVGALTAATREIAAGDYEVRVPVHTRDEFGLLGQAFNAMTAGLALRERYHSVLKAVADPAVANRLLQRDAEFDGVQKEVSVLFCDIRGFTALSERLPAPAVIDLLNRHMTIMTAVTYEHGGTVDKFVGDQLMVLFGAPESGGDDAARAVRCALAMRKERARLNQDASLPLEVGIGIATGQVVAGCMGSEKRLNYTVVGHRVNLAARLCGLAAAGQIVIDDETCAQLPASLAVSPLPPARLKGISDLVPCHAVLGEKPA